MSTILLSHLKPPLFSEYSVINSVSQCHQLVLVSRKKRNVSFTFTSRLRRPLEALQTTTVEAFLLIFFTVNRKI